MFRTRFESLESRHLMTQLFDIDGNGRSDVVEKNAWYDLVAPGEFVEHRVLDGTAQIMGIGDFDRDGDPDLLTNESRWMENEAGKFSKAHFVGKNLGDWNVGTTMGTVLDADGDGDSDILTWNGNNTSRMEWLKNDGRGVFVAEIVMVPPAIGTERFADFDKDGVMEVFGIARTQVDDPNAKPGANGYLLDEFIVQTLGTNARRKIWEARTYFDDIFRPEWFNLVDTDLADINGDQAVDILLHYRDFADFGPLGWLKNDGNGNFPADYEQILPRYPHSIRLTPVLGDGDADGDLDIALNYSYGPAPLKMWFQFIENRNGQFILDSDRNPGQVTELMKIDGDNVIDFIGESIYGPPVWRDGATGGRHYMVKPNAQKWISDIQNEIYNPGIPPSFFPDDWDLDGNAGVNQQDVELALETLGTGAGDANLDGIFDSSDLIQVFQAGRFENGQPKSATWQTGDWNTDGKFNTADLVMAFQKGKYRP